MDAYLTVVIVGFGDNLFTAALEVEQVGEQQSFNEIPQRKENVIKDFIRDQPFIILYKISHRGNPAYKRIC